MSSIPHMQYNTHAIASIQYKILRYICYRAMPMANTVHRTRATESIPYTISQYICSSAMPIAYAMDYSTAPIIHNLYYIKLPIFAA